MLLKFFNRGSGRGSGPVEYILKEKDANGLARDPLPELLKGNPQLTTTLIDSLTFKHKYTSGVLSFAPDDAPTPDQQAALIQSFEDTAFAGLEPDQYSILWVRHTHTSDGRVELHFVTPRVELTTGKSLNIAPPGWQNYFRPWRDYWNLTHNWASPDDPNRARLHSPGYEALVIKQQERLDPSVLQSLNRNNIRTYLTENFIVPYIEQGVIQTRSDIIDQLKSSGFDITRQGENYITVFHPDLAKKVRLKGGIYHESWRVGEKAATASHTGHPTDREALSGEIDRVSRQLEQNVQKRRDFHRGRYGTSSQTHQTSPVASRRPNYEPLSDYLNRQLSDDSIFNESTQRDSTESENPRPTQTEDLGNTTLPSQRREIHHSSPQHSDQDRLEVSREALFKAVEEDTYDGTRETVISDLQELCDSIRAGQGAARRVNQTTEQTNQQLNRANQIAQECHRQLRETAERSRTRQRERKRRLTDTKAQELERFKTEINLVNYLQSQGYQIDSKKTSRNCIVLKHPTGEKLLVGVDETDNHYFYTNVGDNTDKGSIIDFIQHRQHLNLGEVRKELRAWMSGTYSPPTPSPQPTPSSPDRHLIQLQVETFQAIPNHPYLLQRGLTEQTTYDSRFQGTLFSDNRNNVIFLHKDYEGVCGYEIRNRNFKGFSEGGTKGLWVSQASLSDRKLVICESPIDCLSYHQLFPDPNTRYMATGGTLSQKQKNLLRGAFEKIHRQGGEIIIATDNDEAGLKMASQLNTLAPKTAQVRSLHPKPYKDWNEALQAYFQGVRQELDSERREQQLDEVSNGEIEL